MEEWAGITPYYLMIRYRNPSDGNPAAQIVDVDEGGWMEKYDDIIGVVGRWYLVNKETRAIPLAMTVEDGDKPIYRARHVAIGNLSGELPPGVTHEVICYGLGKELADGGKRMIWHFPQGLSVMDDDANPLGMEVLNMMNGIAVAQAAQASTTTP